MSLPWLAAADVDAIEKGKVVNCHLVQRDPEVPLFIIRDGYVLANLDGYLIAPKEFVDDIGAISKRAWRAKQPAASRTDETITPNATGDGVQEAFEAWARGSGWLIDLYRYSNGRYISTRAEASWDAWQAATLRTPNAEPGEAVADAEDLKLADDIFAGHIETGEVRSLGTDDWWRIITALRVAHRYAHPTDTATPEVGRESLDAAVKANWDLLKRAREAEAERDNLGESLQRETRYRVLAQEQADSAEAALAASEQRGAELRGDLTVERSLHAATRESRDFHRTRADNAHDRARAALSDTATGSAEPAPGQREELKAIVRAAILATARQHVRLSLAQTIAGDASNGIDTVLHARGGLFGPLLPHQEAALAHHGQRAGGGAGEVEPVVLDEGVSAADVIRAVREKLDLGYRTHGDGAYVSLPATFVDWLWQQAVKIAMRDVLLQPRYTAVADEIDKRLDEAAQDPNCSTVSLYINEAQVAVHALRATATQPPTGSDKRQEAGERDGLTITGMFSGGPVDARWEPEPTHDNGPEAGWIAANVDLPPTSDSDTGSGRGGEHDDYVTHHHDWRKACVIAKEAAAEEADKLYWQHQVDTLDNLAKRAPARDAESRQRVVKECAATRDVLAERRRQVEAEGWSAEHDDAHDGGEMARAALSYVAAVSIVSRLGGKSYSGSPPLDHLTGVDWPWDRSFWKPGPVRRMLVKAGALTLAEIERLDRRAIANPDTAGQDGGAV